MKTDRIDLAMAGLGGQGSILAGTILGTAAVSFAGKCATQTQAYSSELRGGFAATWVIVSNQPVLFPRVHRPDVLVAQAQDSIDRFCGSLKDNGILLIDSDMVHSFPESIDRVFQVPGTSNARNVVKAPITTNIVMLGALCKVTGILERSAFERAIVQSVPQGKDKINLQAFELGYNTVSERI